MELIRKELGTLSERPAPQSHVEKTVHYVIRYTAIVYATQKSLQKHSVTRKEARIYAAEVYKNRENPDNAKVNLYLNSLGNIIKKMVFNGKRLSDVFKGNEIQGFAQAEHKLKAKVIIWNDGNKPKNALWKPVYDYCCSLGFCR